MSDILEEYKAYYSVRAEKYQDNSMYENSFLAEKNLSDAMQSCNTLEEFKDKIGNLNELCAMALIKDESLIEKAFFDKHNETVRIKASEEILEKADSCKDVLELSSMVVEVENANSIKISMDESHREFQSDWDQVDDITIYENAIVPDKYKNDMMSSAQESRDSIIKGIESLEQNNNDWQAGWRINPDANLEHRHKRLIPYSELHIQEQLAKYKSIINR